MVMSSSREEGRMEGSWRVHGAEGGDGVGEEAGLGGRGGGGWLKELCKGIVPAF